MEVNIGKIIGIHGNMITLEFDGEIRQNEVGYVVLGEDRLKAEVIRIRGNRAEMQVFEPTEGLGVNDQVEFTGSLLSVQLGPGLLGQVYDGLQNPLIALAERCGFFLTNGVHIDALDPTKTWDFQPLIGKNDTVRARDFLGTVRGPGSKYGNTVFNFSSTLFLSVGLEFFSDF